MTATGTRTAHPPARTPLAPLPVAVARLCFLIAVRVAQLALKRPRYTHAVTSQHLQTKPDFAERYRAHAADDEYHTYG